MTCTCWCSRRATFSALWSVVALIVQLVAFAAVRLMVPAISQHVRDGQVSSGMFLGAVAIALGVLNAASMTY